MLTLGSDLAILLTKNVHTCIVLREGHDHTYDGLWDQSEQLCLGALINREIEEMQDKIHTSSSRPYMS